MGDEEIKHEIASQQPYAQWLEGNKIDLATLPAAPPRPPLGTDERRKMLRAFGYTREDLRLLLAPMATAGEEPTGSMGTDAPLAVLSRATEARSSGTSSSSSRRSPIRPSTPSARSW